MLFRSWYWHWYWWLGLVLALVLVVGFGIGIGIGGITAPANAIFQTVPGGTSGTDGASGIDISNSTTISSGGAGGGPLEHGVYIDSASASLDVTTSFTKTVRIPNGTNIGNIRWGSKNRELRLLFDGTSTVYMAPLTGRTSADIVLSGSTNFIANAGNILSLVHDGTIWREVSRNTEWLQTATHDSWTLWICRSNLQFQYR